MPDLTPHSPDVLKTLAHDLRWRLLKALTTSDHRVQELVAVVHEPMNLVSYHLKKLRDDGLVQARRSDADGRDIYYRLDLDRLRDLYWGAAGALHPALKANQPGIPDLQRLLDVRVLFLCTHNSARSQMAEGLLRHVTGGQLAVQSAGSQPSGIHPEAVTAMDALGIDIRGQASTHLSDLTDQPFDYVITVCDKVREVCPTFPGGGQQLHWGLPDPAAIDDSAERARAFTATAAQLQSRIHTFLTTLATA